jgi:1-acyl-sn-glycerol-3-phosphate acyltransferase
MVHQDIRYPRHTWLYMPTIRLMRFVVHLVSRVHVEGVENVPDDGSLLYVSNHLHYFDAPLIGTTLPRLALPLAAAEYETHIFGVFLKIIGAIFIDRFAFDRSALRQALNALEDGQPVAVAVEGTRSRTGQLGNGKDGAAFLATRAGVPVQPVVIWGVENIIPALKHLRRADVFVRFGEPFWLAEGRVRTDQLSELTEQVMITLARLLPEEYRGIYREHPAVNSGM